MLRLCARTSGRVPLAAPLARKYCYSGYQDAMDKARDVDAYWGKAAKDIVWDKPYEAVLNGDQAPFYKWFPGGFMNTCYNAVDRHVAEGRGNQTAIVYDSPVAGSLEHISYADLQSKVAQFAGTLKSLGVEKGDTVVIYMPNIPETAVAMLGCARIGAIHSVVFGGFAADELAKRIDDAAPKVIIAASCGIEPKRTIAYKPLLDAAIEQAGNKPEHTIIVQREQLLAELGPTDHSWSDIVPKSSPTDCVPLESNHPLYILYTSGTTGMPKGVVRSNGGHAVALKWTMKHFYDVNPGDVFWAASDVGWVVGHSYIVYGPLLHGCTTVMYEGKPVGTPDAGAFWRVIEQHKVNAIFTAPTALRAIRGEDSTAALSKNYDLSSMHSMYIAGERADPATLRWASEHIKTKVNDHWWQTETGWPIAGNPHGLEHFAPLFGSAGRPLPGYDLQCVDEDSKPVAAGEIGELVIKLPLPPGTLLTLWKNDDRFVDSYLSAHKGYYRTGDSGFLDQDGLVHVMSRIDDVINVAGHRLSTGAMEEVICDHPDVVEAAVVGVDDELRAQVPMGFVVVKSGVDSKDVSAQTVALIRDKIGAIACFKDCRVVKRLPKTRSGKILRKTIRQIVQGDHVPMPATIEDPDVLREIEEVLSKK